MAENRLESVRVRMVSIATSEGETKTLTTYYCGTCYHRLGVHGFHYYCPVCDKAAPIDSVEVCE